MAAWGKKNSKGWWAMSRPGYSAVARRRTLTMLPSYPRLNFTNGVLQVGFVTLVRPREMIMITAPLLSLCFFSDPLPLWFYFLLLGFGFYSKGDREPPSILVFRSSRGDSQRSSRGAENRCEPIIDGGWNGEVKRNKPDAPSLD